MKKYVFIIIFLFLSCSLAAVEIPRNPAAGEPLLVTHSIAGEDLLKQARGHLFVGEIKKGLSLLDSVLKSNKNDSEALYLKGECYCLYGNKEVQNILQQLRKSGCSQYADILDIKIDQLLGDANIKKKLTELKIKYPFNSELELVDWQYKVSAGDYALAKSVFRKLSDHVVLGFIPYKVIYLTEKLINSSEADTIAAEAVRKNFLWFKALKPSLAKKVQNSSSNIFEMELPLIECGPYFGIEMIDSLGNKITVSLDTGTSDAGFTIHKKDVGSRLAGTCLDTLKNAIQYRYMPHPVDLYHKLVSFKSPEINHLTIGYFEGGLINSDGVFSPLALRNLAITVDPIHKKVFLRNREALEKYILRLNRNYEEVNYINRSGWIYIPCKLNDHEVMMMVETGSRDVNVNSIAVRRYGIPIVEGTLSWQGKDHPVKRPEIRIKIGEIEYRPKDALVDDFVMGNCYTGQASAGDLGPEFLRNFVFTIDPFIERLIFEK
ncbi:MAG: hypothetical protein ACM3RX_06350 [Methanococcaceae archaeon]